mgnify:CR=1 FL=1
MNSYRITKYDPKLRNRQGSFDGDEWTTVGDIGKQFETGLLTVADYLSVENRYVESVLFIWQCAGTPSLCITELESKNLKRKKSQTQPELCDIATGTIPKNGQMIEAPVLIEKVVRLILREFLWCKLEAKNGLFFHFGWDY